MQVLVVGAGVVGLAVARAMAIAGHDVVVAEAASGGHRGVLPQQRSHPRRPLLSDRIAARLLLSARTAHAL